MVTTSRVGAVAIKSGTGAIKETEATVGSTVAILPAWLIYNTVKRVLDVLLVSAPFIIQCLKYSDSIVASTSL